MDSADMGIIGIPCPLFSALNQRKRTDPNYNPFLETFGRTVHKPGVGLCHSRCLCICAFVDMGCQCGTHTSLSDLVWDPRPGADVVLAYLRRVRKYNPRTFVLEEVTWTSMFRHPVQI